MNILYIGYWSVTEGLSEATIKPHLEILANMENINRIVYVSIERSKEKVKCTWDIPKMEHIPFYSPPKPFFLDKIYDFTVLPKQLILLCAAQKITKIICRTTLAGAIGYLIWGKTRIPYYVESFEPHADYMLKSEVWTKFDPRYWLQYYFEQKQKLTASGLFPVSENYRRKLNNQEKIRCPIEVIPCSVDINKFQFKKSHRIAIRKHYNLSESVIVGIYVGKFGDIYYDNEAFIFFKSCLNYFDDFFLFVLTPQDQVLIENKFKQVEYPLEKCWLGKVDHNEVSHYLSASDVAFSLHKTSQCSMAFSPIKNGEYWANGLPILTSEGIGDDSDIIKKEGGGLVVDFEQIMSNEQFMKLFLLIQVSNNNRNSNLSVNNGLVFRGNNIVKLTYKKLINNEDLRQIG